jgi:hypothetical protein
VHPHNLWLAVGVDPLQELAVDCVDVAVVLVVDSVQRLVVVGPLDADLMAQPLEIG